MSNQAIAYYRVSTVKQGASGLGMEAQQMAVAQHARAAGLEIAQAYTEVESGKRNDRPELAAALAACKTIGGTLLIAKLDRLARNVHFISGLMESGVKFVAVDNPTVTPLTLHVLAAVAEQEAKAISARTIAALGAARARGTKLGKPENLTPAAQAKSARVNRERAQAAYAKTASYLRILRMEKGMTFAAIANTLNADGHTTRTGKPFAAMTIKRMCDRAGINAIVKRHQVQPGSGVGK